MLGFLASVGAVLEKFKHAPRPVLWGVGVVLALLALDFFAHEAIDVYVKLATARATIEQANEQAAKTAAERRSEEAKSHAITQKPVDLTGAIFGPDKK
jgi:hypothetical protein